MANVEYLVLVVRDLERALGLYERGLGFARVEEVSDVPAIGARRIFLRAENCLLELLEPHDETKPPGSRRMRERGATSDCSVRPRSSTTATRSGTSSNPRARSTCRLRRPSSRTSPGSPG